MDEITVRLGDICEIRKGECITRSETLPSGTYEVVGGGNRPLGFVETANVSGGISVSCKGSAGTVLWHDGGYFATDSCFVLEFVPGVCQKYIYHVLKSRETALMAASASTTIPCLKKATLSCMELNLPPYARQCEISEKLDRAERLLASITEVIAYRQAMYRCMRDEVFAKLRAKK